MDAQVGRRVFVGSIVAGLPLLVGEGSRGFAQSAARAGAAVGTHDHGAVESAGLGSSAQVTIARMRDPINEELQRQLQQLVPQIRKGRSAAARQVAGLMRISSVQSAHTLDAPLNVHLRQAIAEYGKSGFLINHGPSHETLRRELAAYGVSIDQLRSSASYALKERALDALLASGLSAHLAKVAEVLDVMAAQMEARGPVIPAARQAYDPTALKCQQMLGYLQAAEATVASICGAMGLFPNPVTAAACAFALGGLAGLVTAYAINCLF